MLKLLDLLLLLHIIQYSQLKIISYFFHEFCQLHKFVIIKVYNAKNKISLILNLEIYLLEM